MLQPRAGERKDRHFFMGIAKTSKKAIGMGTHQGSRNNANQDNNAVAVKTKKKRIGQI